ncbi:MAG TPA: hypothetical protein VFT22_31765 [Kofleriaceae bacterium]|nr:hypothetical protein [Kofleriaceae bacterium]
MNIKAILASLILGSSSLALASPAASVTVTAQGSYAGPVVRDHRAAEPCETPAAEPAYEPTYEPIAQPVWNGGGHTLPPVYRPVTLASALRFGRDGRTFIPVGSRAGQFRTLEISGAGGRTFIKQVFVQFGNGQTQVIRNLDRMLTAGQSLTLDLDGGRRNISRIVVYGSDRAGWRRAAGAFTVTAS